MPKTQFFITPEMTTTYDAKKNFDLEHVCGMPLLYKKLSHDYVDAIGISVIGFQAVKVL